MAKDQVSIQGVIGVSARMPSKEFLMEFLTKALDSPAGLSVCLAPEREPFTLRRGVVSNIHICSAWVGFDHNGVRIRTDTISDRNRFEAWYTSPNPAPYSNHRDYVGVFGPPNVTFYRAPGLHTVH